MDKCGATGKDIYLTKQEAREAIRRRGFRGSRPAYWCVFCSGWHHSRSIRHNGAKGGKG